MPLIQVRTNMDQTKMTNSIQGRISAKAAELMNKPEARVSVTIEGGLQMCRGGSFDPVLEIHIAAIGIDAKEKTQPVVVGLTQLLMEAGLGLKQERIVFKFTNLQPHMVGVDGNTM